MDLGRMVRDFHEKHGFALDLDLSKIPVGKQITSLREVGEHVKELSQKILQEALVLQKQGDPRLYRSHLMLEELGELILGMAARDEVQTADGGSDLLYVVAGTMESFGLPVKQCVEEVQRSNMSKKKRDPSNDRMRDKGPDYTPPDLAWAIARGRDSRRWNKESKQDGNV